MNLEKIYHTYPHEIFNICVFSFFLSQNHRTTLRLGLESITPNVGGYQVDENGGDEFFSFNPGVRVGE